MVLSLLYSKVLKIQMRQPSKIYIQVNRYKQGEREERSRENLIKLFLRKFSYFSSSFFLFAMLALAHVNINLNVSDQMMILQCKCYVYLFVNSKSFCYVHSRIEFQVNFVKFINEMIYDAWHLSLSTAHYLNNVYFIKQRTPHNILYITHYTNE